MLKNIFYAVLFIALVVGLSFVMSTYLPIQQVTNIPSNTAELTQLKAQVNDLIGLKAQVAELTQLKAQVAEFTLIAEQVSALSQQLESLGQRSTPEVTPIPIISESRSQLLGQALLQTLNCKYVASNNSGARLIAELVLLEETITQIDINQETLLREIILARTETAAHIPSAQDRLEIIWKLLLAVDKKP